MNHYCTYFDRGFLVQGLALWRSLEAHDPEAVLWVLALDDVTHEILHDLKEPGLEAVSLGELEAADLQLAAAKDNRTRVEYYFTLSPCWPRWLLATQPGVERITYLDADLFFFANPAPIFTAMEVARASVLITAHRFPSWLEHYEKHGRFNVGVLVFHNDPAGRACLDQWRAQCLEWCYDQLEDARYADQKYLDQWPTQLGASLLVLDHPGVNFAPWNWAGASVNAPRHAENATTQLSINGSPLIVFHFARYREAAGSGWSHAGQLDYGVMPYRLRNAIYGPYSRALAAARAEILARRPEFMRAKISRRSGREFWRTLPLRIVFGGDWLRIGGRFHNLRFGLGRWSGQCLAALRRLRFRRNRTSENTSHTTHRAAEK